MKFGTLFRKAVKGMEKHQSTDELLYKHVIEGNIEAVKALGGAGANLEWIDSEGKTPLIVACMCSDRFNIAPTLIELGANVNAYRPGRRGGTPLHHAAKRGLNQTVKLLLSRGANPLIRNDACQTPVEVARTKEFPHIVRIIEDHICLFSGWLREFYAPGLLQALAPQFLSRKIWVVVIPNCPRKLGKPPKLELVMYSTFQDAQPRTIIPLWKAKIEEPKFNQSDPFLFISNKLTNARFKFAAANNGDKHQLQRMYNACRGIPQVTPQIPLDNCLASKEAHQFGVMKINANLPQSTIDSRPPVLPNNRPTSEASNTGGWGDEADFSSHNGWGSSSAGFSHSQASSNGWMYKPVNEEYDGWGSTVAEDIGHNPQHSYEKPTSSKASGGGGFSASTDGYNGWMRFDSKTSSSQMKNPRHPETTPPFVFNSNEVPTPSAPPIPEEGFIDYPSITTIPSAESGISGAVVEKDENGSSSCVICWEAPVEGACIPCGHMAGCMNCLNEIKANKAECPVCRAKVNQILRLYAV